eukprot:COSAG02_NODE_1120_length_14453_cov_511.865055_10_plen_196_part_00
MQRLFVLSSGSTAPTIVEAEALFFRSTGLQADTPGFLRLPDFQRLCALGSCSNVGAAGLKEEMQPPAAVEYIGRHCELILTNLTKPAASANFGLEETINQAAEGYATMAQLRQALCKSHPTNDRRGSTGRSNVRPGLVLTEKGWEELERLADPTRAGVFDYEAFVRCAWPAHDVILLLLWLPLVCDSLSLNCGHG